MRALKRDEEPDQDVTRDADQRRNDETRLPPNETVQLGGLILAEVFPPSTITALVDALENMPVDGGQRKRDWSAELGRSRSGERGGWQSLGVIRPPGDGVGFFGGVRDSDLPAGVAGVFLHLEYLLPSVTVVVATFCLEDAACDLSPHLRQDFRMSTHDAVVRVSGPLGGVRSRIPWSRPRHYSSSAQFSTPEDHKRRACEAHMATYEDACQRWMAARFPGRFAQEEATQRPIVRLLFTQQDQPLVTWQPWFEPVVGRGSTSWQSVPEGWAFTSDRLWNRDRPNLLILTAQRAEAARAKPWGDSARETNWDLTYLFSSDQSPLIARQALLALLSVYSGRLARLRDEAAARRAQRRPVTEALALDDYLIRDGLDAATVTSDVHKYMRRLEPFRWNVPEYQELLDGATPGGRAPAEYVPQLRRAIRRRATQLAEDTATTTGNVRASAELRQAVANTRLQRLVLVLSVLALLVAVIGFVAGKT